MFGNGGFQEADRNARYTGRSVVAKGGALRVMTIYWQNLLGHR
jgi:hypothetical protein